MVMETPGPQEVGREFVRQYYTMLHEAPLHLHRFYSNNSAFVHGGVEKAGNEQPPVIGQEDIHKKIISLDFRDCHAKIRQVDSQSTVGDAVVVQVTGELSNKGEPMRRFMQTFVLVPQSPKKFYVHNDIFRYQDEVFHDEDGEADDSDRFITDPREVEGVSGNVQVQEPIQPVTPEVSPPAHFEQVPLSNGSIHEVKQPQPPVKPVQPVQPVEPTPPPVVTPPQPAKIVPEVSPFAEKDSGVSEEPQTESYVFEQKPEPKPAPVVEPPVTHYPEHAPEPSKPVSWAALASKNTAAGMAPPTAASFPAPQPHPSSKPAAPKPTEPARNTEGNNTQAPQPQRPQRQSREPEREKTSGGGQGDGQTDSDGMNGRRSYSSGGGSGTGTGGIAGTRYADNQQLFVGNLPLDISEKELKDFFEGYGKVEDLRINTKSGGGKVPNFGFVVFKSPDTVQKILKIKSSSQAIKYNDHRLNVEEKKPRGSDGGMRGGRGAPRGGGGVGGQGVGRSGSGGFSNGSSGRGGAKSGGGFGRSDMRGSSSSGGQRGGGSSSGSQQGRR